jgi:hypothetical protein
MEKDTELSMGEMQFFLKVANGDSVPAAPPFTVLASRVKDKLGDNIFKVDDGFYNLDQIPENLVINLREGIVKLRQE